jgi:nucleolin
MKTQNAKIDKTQNQSGKGGQHHSDHSKNQRAHSNKSNEIEETSLGKRPEVNLQQSSKYSKHQSNEVQNPEIQVDKKVKQETNTNANDTQVNEVFVGGISFNATEKNLKDFFNSCGVITLVKIVYNKEGKSRGRGFVKFTTPEGVKRALQLNGSVFLGKPIIVDAVKSFDNLFQNPEENPNLKVNAIIKDFTPKQSAFDQVESSTLLVRNLSYEVTETDLLNIFKDCGGVKNTRIIRRNTGLSKGYGFADFESIEQAKKGLEKEGSVIKGRRITLEFSAPKNVRHEGINPNGAPAFVDKGEIALGQAGSRPASKKGFITKFEGDVVEL